LALEVDTTLASRRVTRVLEAIIAERGVSQVIRCDNGPELTSRHFSGLVCRAENRVGTHPVGATHAKRARGKFSRQTAGRMLKGEWVREFVPGAA
jgi:hypothetical protein